MVRWRERLAARLKLNRALKTHLAANFVEDQSQYRRTARSALRAIHDGQPERTINLPGGGTISAADARDRWRLDRL